MEIMSDKIGNLAAALAMAQAEMQPAKKESKNQQFGKYADLASCWDAIKDILPKHKLAVSQLIAPAEADRISVVTILMHESGEWVSSTCTLKAEGNRGVNAAQAAGSAITYARRYGLAAIVGLATDDDDGNAAGTPIAPQKSRQAPQTTRQQKPEQKPAPTPAEAPLQDESDPNAIIQPGSRQFKALFARLAGEMGCQNREDYLIELSKVLGRTVESSKTLTIAEFHRFMKATEPETNFPL